MDLKSIKQEESAYLMPVYGRFDIAISSGKGAVAADESGREYIDFGAGIGVNSLGYSDSGWASAVSVQAAKLQHTSNLYYSEVQINLAKRLCGLSGMGKAFFCNSGAEANECAIKLCRKYSFDKYGEGRDRIITLQNSFHGRTVTTLSATGQEAFHNYFFPFTEGFGFAPAGDIDTLRELSDSTVCGIMIELIQGEGGVLPLEEDYVKAVRALCDERDILLIVDEVQTGISRTGSVFCYEQYDIIPDIVTLAKGLGGGLPIGACLCSNRLGNVLSAGTHGTTYGGNPVVCAGANYVLEKVTDKAFLEDVVKKGETIRDAVKKMPGVAEVRGKGLITGISLKAGEARKIAEQCLSNGLIILTAKTALRMLPPLNIPYDEIDRGLSILREVLDDNFE